MEFKAVKYLVSLEDEIYLECRDEKKDKWAITHKGRVWNYAKNDWEWEPMPSSRTDKFFKECRSDLDFAKNTAIELFHTYAVLSEGAKND